MLLYRFATATAVVCFLLLLVGGLVHNTDSGLACGRAWPACEEVAGAEPTMTPTMTGGVAIEHGHRLLASSVGLLTIGLAAIAWRERRRGRASGARTMSLAVAAVGLVIAQGLLGALTVRLGLSPAVSTSHLGMSMLFFGVLVAV